MNIFKKKSLCAALAGIGALGAAGAAQAVNLNPDGLGQVLIYPYYTTRSDGAGNVYNSLLSVVNSTASVRAVKVRFLEGASDQRGRAFCGIDVSLHFTKRNRRVGHPAIGMKNRVVRIFPALLH